MIVVLRNPTREVDFFFGYLQRAADQFTDADTDRDQLAARTRCGAPTPAGVCAFCRLVERATSAQPVNLDRTRHHAAPSTTTPEAATP